MATPRDYALGAAAAIVIVLGYSAFPSGTLFEWAVVGVAFVVGVLWALFSKRRPQWREVGGIALAGIFFAVFGAGARMWLNDFTLMHTVLLVREEKYVWSSLLPFGYWLIAGAAGYALVMGARALSDNHHATRPE
jgi:hypothetical protein